MLRNVGTLVAAIGFLTSASWSQEYSVVNLGTLGGNYSYPYSVNNAGQVAGQAELPTTAEGISPQHPFLYSNGTMMDLGTLGGDFGEATSVNEQGDVAGETELSNPGIDHAFLWSAGAIHDLDPSNPGVESQATGINAAGVIVGVQGNVAVEFSSGNIQAIPHAPFQVFFPEGINAAGQVGGVCNKTSTSRNRACSVTGSVVTAFPSLLTNGESIAYAINSAGDLCGTTANANRKIAVLWSGGSAFNLGRLPGGFSTCWGLNDFGQQVGDSYPGSGISSHAVLFDAVNGARDLNHLIPQNPNRVLLRGTSISNTGLITAWCVYGGNRYRACLLKPNAVLILKKNIFALEQNDPGCIQCGTVLDPEARSLPDSLVDLTPEQRKSVTATVDLIASQLRQLQRADQITQAQANLLVHQSQLVISAIAAL